MSTSSGPITSQQTYNASVDAVWKAITDKDQMVQWFFPQIAEFKAEPGFATEFNVNCEGTDYLHVWKIKEVSPPGKISYGWKYGGVTGDSTVHWNIEATPDGTQLTLTHESHEPFDMSDPNMSRESCQAGWDYFLKDSLKKFLDGES